MKKLMLEKQNL